MVESGESERLGVGLSGRWRSAVLLAAVGIPSLAAICCDRTNGGTGETTLVAAATVVPTTPPTTTYDVTFRLTSLTPGDAVSQEGADLVTGVMTTTLGGVFDPATNIFAMPPFFGCDETGIQGNEPCFPTDEPEFYPDPTKPVSQTCPSVQPAGGKCVRFGNIIDSAIDNISWLRHWSVTPAANGQTTLPLVVTFRDLSLFGAGTENPIPLDFNLDLTTGIVTPVALSNETAGTFFLSEFANNCLTFQTGTPSPGSICFAVDVTSATTSHGIVDFNLLNVFYDPPGAQSVQQYGTNYTVGSTTSWQLVTKNGETESSGVSLSIGPTVPDEPPPPVSPGTTPDPGTGTGPSFQPALGFNFGGQTTEQLETISGGSVSTSRTDTTMITINAHSDFPSGILDAFFLALDIPAALTVFSDNRPPNVDLDYASSQTVVLNGAQLLAIAQSASNVDELLGLTITDPSFVQTVKTFVTPADAQSILLTDPNFFVTPGGTLAVRNLSQLNQVVQANTDRFEPQKANLSGAPAPVPQTALQNTLPVLPASPPYSLFQTFGFGQSVSNSTASSTSTGNGTDFQLQSTVGISIPGLFVTGTGSETDVFEQEYQKVNTTTTGTGTQDQVTFQMGSPCLSGLVDLYYDTVFGTYLYVSHDIGIIPNPTPPNPPAWFSKCTGSTGSLDGTACSVNTDCQSQLCTNGVCTPPACSQTPNLCPNGSACGLSGPTSECSTQNCSIGVCTEAFLLMSCTTNTDCATGACVNGVCGSPACSPNCQEGAGCGVNADCTSQVCAFGTCLPPACSPACAEGASCSVNGDCTSGVCTNGLCGPPACSPHCPQATSCASNGECGSQVCTNGTCQPPACAPNCDFGAGCGANSDCVSQVCTNGSCQAPVCAPTCSETAVCDQNSDCAAKICTSHKCAPPACSPTCNDGTACGANSECGSQVCTNAVCAPPACAPHCSQGAACGASGDCGTHVCTGGLCHACSPKCDQGAVCSGNGDCESKVCVGGVCKSPSCAPHCNQGTVCGANTDCGSQVCTNGLCGPPACSPHCTTGGICGVNADCLSLVCTGNVCHAPSCSPRCSANSACGVNGDCLSRVCTNGICKPPACSPTCARGANCDSNTECASHVCTSGICQ